MVKSHWQTIDRIVSRVFSGESTAAERVELAQLLERDCEARRTYTLYIQESADLRWLCAKANEQGTDQLHSPTATWANKRATAKVAGSDITSWLVAASILLLITTAGYSVWSSLGDRNHAPVVALEIPPGAEVIEIPLAPTVATVSRLVNASWAPGVVPGKELSRLRVGDVVDLESGEIELVFDAGVELLARGASRFRIESPLSVFGEYGTLSARVGESGRGFTINTATAKIVDRGTQFGVSIEADGRTDVACFEGEVDLSCKAKQDDRDAQFHDRLLQGEGLSVASEGTASRLYYISDFVYPSLSFHRRPATMQHPTIAKVRDTISDPANKKFYRIVPGGFGEDAQAYVDRPHEWNGIEKSGLPEFLLGADYVMSFNNDKFADTFEMEVEISHPTVLYVLISDAVEVPDWLSESFEDTNEDVGLDEGKHRWIAKSRNIHVDVGPGNSIDTRFSVWSRVIDRPMTIRLGDIKRPENIQGYNMYGLAAKAIAPEKHAASDAMKSPR